MSDNPQGNDPGDQPDATPADDTQEQGEPASDAPLGEGGKKALDAERTARKEAERSASDLQMRIEAMEAEKLSDLEKAQKQAKKAQDEAATAKAEALRMRVATKHGLTEEDAELLGDDPERAERLAERIAANKTSDIQPRPDPTQGGMGAIGAKSKGDRFADFADNFFTR